MKKNYFGYVRVSTTKQGHGVSLTEQRAAISRHADRMQVQITEWFEEQETAAKTGRPIWRNMLARLRKREVDGVLIHKIDRSARNLRDWADVGDLIDRGVEVHFVSESLDLHSRGGRLSADIQAVIAADYIRNLREEILKGFYGRIHQGILPLPAPLGYRDEGAGKPKTIDPEKGPLVRKAFELYASGTWNLHLLREEMDRLGLRNRHGSKVSLNGLSTMLRNPFYIGLIRLRKTRETFQGSHEALIPKSIFERVQEVLDGKVSSRPLRHAFLFRRLLRCASCNYSLIGETRKGHIYYRCHSKSCPRTTLREERVNDALLPHLRALELAPEEVAYIAVRVSELRAEWETRALDEMSGIKRRLGELGARLTKLTDAFLDGALDRDLFEERKTALLLERRELEEKLVLLAKNPETSLTKLEEYLGLARSPYFQYLLRNPDEKRELVLELTSDRRVIGKEPYFTLALPYNLIAKRFEDSCGGPYRDIPRTWDHLLPQLVAICEAAQSPPEFDF